MLLQRRGETLWLIKQHDHGWLSGAMAQAWAGFGEPQHLPHALCLAASLHDYPWQDYDRLPTRNPETQQPHDFLSLPLAERLPLYQGGIDLIEEIHPHVALLVSMHYAAFKGLRETQAFQVHEAQRQKRLQTQLGFGPAHKAMLSWQLAFVQLFDLLSLYICLTAPGVSQTYRPPWLLPDGKARTPEGEPFVLSWQADDILVCDPMPLREALRVRLPTRQIPALAYPDDAALQEAWEAAEVYYWELEVRGPETS